MEGPGHGGAPEKHVHRSTRTARIRRKDRPGNTRKDGQLLGMLRIAVILILAAVVLLLLVVLSRPSRQYLNTPEIQRIQRLGVLRIGVLDGAPGFSDNDAGLEIDIARELCRRIFPDLDPDVTMELVHVNNYTALPKLGNDVVDIVLARRTAADPETYANSGAYFSEAIRLLTRPELVNEPLVSGRVVGFIGGGAEDRAWEAFNARGEITLSSTELASYEELGHALQNGAIHYIALPASHVPLLESWGFVQHPTALGAANYVAVTRLENTALASMMDITLEDLRQDGTLGNFYALHDLGQYMALGAGA